MFVIAEQVLKSVIFKRFESCRFSSPF